MKTSTEAVKIAQAEFDKHQPQVVVGSSRGGAVAMNINSGEARLVLLCPAWKKYGTARTVKPGTVILHSRADDVVPFADSEELVRNSGCRDRADRGRHAITGWPTRSRWRRCCGRVRMIGAILRDSETSIRSYRRTSEPIREMVTKFGGQPVWIDEPMWPLSGGSDVPMRFLCQIFLDPSVFAEGPARMAYLFVTQPERKEIEDGAFDPDIIFADGGENAVIVQPGGVGTADTCLLRDGPSLYDYEGEPCELACELVADQDHEYIARSDLSRLAREDRGGFESYLRNLTGDKIGGTPLFGNNDNWPGNGPWSLLLQLMAKRTPHDPFYLNLGATLATGFAFISTDKKRGASWSIETMAE